MEERHHNYEAPLVSLAENYRMIGLAGPGVYAGFDDMSVVLSTQMKIVHTVTGSKRLNEAGNADQGPFGVVVTRQGLVIYVDQEFTFTVPYVTTLPRIDLIVAQHTWIDSPGGSAMTVSRIQGAEDANPAPPALSNPLIQVPIGWLKVYSTSSHSTTVFIPMPRKKLGGQYAFDKLDYKSLIPAQEDDFNKQQRSGIYSLSAYALNPPTAVGNDWFVIVARRGDGAVSQIAISGLSGKMYARAAQTIANQNVTLWKPWINMNNPDVPGVDFDPVVDLIGSQLYTEDNYVVDEESVTESIDKLDIALNATDTILANAVVDIDNVEAAVGNRLYSENNKLVDAESITASLEKLDKAFGVVSGAMDLNTVLAQGHYFISGAATNLPAGAGNGSTLEVFKSGTNILQKVWVSGGGGEMVRSSSNSGAAWGTWSQTKLALKSIRIPPWNMDSTASMSAAHGLTAAKIVNVWAIIHNDASSVYTLLIGATPVAVGTNEVSGSIHWNGTDITVNRTTSGFFDSANYDDNTALFFRGDIYVEYLY